MNKPKRIRTDAAESECSLIGSVLLDPSELDRVSGQVSQRDFLDDQLGRLYSVLVDRHDAGLPINDPVLLLDSAKQIFGEPASATLGELFEREPTAAHARFYAEKVVEASKLRRLEQIALGIIDRCQDQSQTSQDIEGFVDCQLESIGCETAKATTNIHQAGLGLIAELETPSNRRPVFSGIESVDCIAGGLLAGELGIIAARPGNGKTSFAMQIAKRLAEQNRPVLFVSLEMKATELVARVLCGMTGTESQYLRRGQANTQKLAEANAELDGLPLTIFDPPTATIQRIRATAKIQRASLGLDLLVVDYIGLIEPRDRSVPRTEQVGEITAGFKRLAKELGIPVIALCQLNRGADGAEPMLSHLRESGNVEQDADVVLFLHRTAPGSNRFRLIIGKHRHGQTGAIEVKFDEKRTRFSEWL